MNIDYFKFKTPHILLWCLTLALFILLTFNQLPSPDLWWQMALGGFTLENRTIPAREPFSFTAQGHPWTNDEWLPGIIFYSLYLKGGLNLLHLFKSFILILAFIITVIASRRTGRVNLPCALGAGLFAMLFSEHAYFFDVRSYLFTYFFTAITFFILAEFDARRNFWILLFLPIFIFIWANFHAGFVAGILIIAGATAASWLEVLSERNVTFTTIFARARSFLGQAEMLKRVQYDNSNASIKAAWQFTLTFVLCTIVSLINVHGFQTLIAPLALISSPFKRHLNEWVPPDLMGNNFPFLIFLCATWLMMVFCRSVLRLRDWLLNFAFTVLAVTAWRNLQLYAFFSITLWAPGLEFLARKFQSIFQSNLIHFPFGGGGFWGIFHGYFKTCVYLLFVTATFISLSYVLFRLTSSNLGSQSMEKQLFPYWAVEFLKANDFPTNLYHPYGWGGYLIWRLYPRYRVFIDGRGIEAYPYEVFKDYLKVSAGTEDMEEILKKWKVLAALTFTAGGPEATSRIFQGKREWIQIYEDDLCQIHLKKVSSTLKIIDNFKKGRLIYPANPFAFANQARDDFLKRDFSLMRRHIEDALKLDEDYAPAYFLMGTMEFCQGSSSEGIRWTKKALKLAPGIAGANYNLAQDALNRGDKNLAVKYLREELKNNPKNRDTWELLEKLERNDGQLNYPLPHKR